MPADGPASLHLYDVPSLPTDDAALVATIRAICDQFEAYGYRRVSTGLRHRGIVVNSKKIRRLMRENDLQPKRRKRFVATTDSDHDECRSSPTSRATGYSTARTRSGWRSVRGKRGRRRRLRLYGRHPRCLVTPGSRICDQPLN